MLGGLLVPQKLHAVILVLGRGEAGCILVPCLGWEVVLMKLWARCMFWGRAFSTKSVGSRPLGEPDCLPTQPAPFEYLASGSLCVCVRVRTDVEDL